MVLVIINTCNRDCPFCFEGDYRRGAPERMSIDDVDSLCEFFQIARSAPVDPVSLLGGEPTLHPDLTAIMDLIRDHCAGKEIVLLTNLTCERELLAEILMRRANLLVNLVEPSLNTVAQQSAVEANLALLAEAPGVTYAVATTIFSPEQDFGWFYDVLRSDRHRQIYNVRVGLSAPGFGFANRFADTMVPAWGEKYLEVVREIHRINPMIRIGAECAVNLCQLAPATYERLATNVALLNRSCSEPNLDILPDFSTHWCFGARHLPGMRIENIFDYPNETALRIELNRRRMALMRRIGLHCDHAACDTIGCPGPCLALNCFLAERKGLAKQTYSRDHSGS